MDAPSSAGSQLWISAGSQLWISGFFCVAAGSRNKGSFRILPVTAMCHTLTYKAKLVNPSTTQRTERKAANSSRAHFSCHKTRAIPAPIYWCISGGGETEIQPLGDPSRPQARPVPAQRPPAGRRVARSGRVPHPPFRPPAPLPRSPVPTRLTCQAAPFAVSPTALEQEEGVCPLRHPQRAGQQHLLGPQPHRGGPRGRPGGSARLGSARPHGGGRRRGSRRAAARRRVTAPTATPGGPAPSRQRGGAVLPLWRHGQGRDSVERRWRVRVPLAESLRCDSH